LEDCGGILMRVIKIHSCKGCPFFTKGTKTTLKMHDTLYGICNYYMTPERGNKRIYLDNVDGFCFSYDCPLEPVTLEVKKFMEDNKI
jgi:hypothetical protein